MSAAPRAIRFSVVIPTRNRPEALGRLLRRLDAQAFPRHEFEIIVVDDAGDVNLEPIVAPHAEDLVLSAAVECHALDRAPRTGDAHSV